MALQNPDELLQAGRVALCCGEKVAGLPVAISVEVALIGEQLVLEGRRALEGGKRCTELR